MVNAEGAIAAGSATEGQLRKVINDALERAGERKLNEPAIKEQLDSWIESEKGVVSEATIWLISMPGICFWIFLASGPT